MCCSVLRTAPVDVQFGHDRVSTFGIGAEHDNRTWRAILRQLIALRLVGVDLAGHERPVDCARRPRLPARQAGSDAARANVPAGGTP